MSGESPPRERPASSPAVSVSSIDGRSFRVVAAPGVGLRVGDYLTFADSEGDEHAGFLEEVAALADGSQSGSGTVLSKRGRPSPGAIRNVEGGLCPPEQIADLLRGDPAAMEIGHRVLPPQVEVGLVASRINRHTFWCGQSGSGKTYALGVALEQVLLNTRLPILIFDPNSDFVRLNEARPDATPEQRDHLAALDIRVLRPGDGPGSLRVRFRSMTARARAAILQLDPVVDRHEYNLLSRYSREFANDPRHFAEQLRAAGDEARLLAERLENLEIFDWQTWSYEFDPATDVIATRPNATVLDLGGFRRIEEQLTVALAVLDDLWNRREERRPVLLVIDEAHNLCAPEMESLVGQAVRDRVIQIAAEGRKFGLWLLISTQRPSKVHPQIVSQCDNLTLMRMNSPGDLDELADVFGFVPPAMLRQSARFRQGEALVAGGFVASPSIITMGRRITAEGGIDVPVPMPGADDR